MDIRQDKHYILNETTGIVGGRFCCHYEEGTARRRNLLGCNEIATLRSQ